MKSLFHKPDHPAILCSSQNTLLGNFVVSEQEIEQALKLLSSGKAKGIDCL